MSWSDRFVTFDTETTGVNGSARILEMSCVQFEKGEVKEIWSTLLCPPDVDWEDENVKKALAVNQIERDALTGQPTFEQIFHHLYIHFGAANIWAAHNSEFDLRMLDQEFQRYKGIKFPLQPGVCLDTMHLSRALHPNERFHKLADVATRWGVSPDGAHRAASDAITCGRILWAMANGHLSENIDEVNEFQKAANLRWKSGRRF